MLVDHTERNNTEQRQGLHTDKKLYGGCDCLSGIKQNSYFEWTFPFRILCTDFPKIHLNE